MPVRGEFVQNAIQFLTDPSVASAPRERKETFLRSKGLSQEEIDEAFAKAGVGTAQNAAGQAVPAVSPAVPSAQSSQLSSSTPAPQLQHLVAAPHPPARPQTSWLSYVAQASVLVALGGVGWNLLSNYVFNSKESVKSRATHGNRRSKFRDTDSDGDSDEAGGGGQHRADHGRLVAEHQQRGRHRQRNNARSQPTTNVKSASKTLPQNSPYGEATTASSPRAADGGQADITPAWFTREKTVLLDELALRQRNFASVSSVVALEARVAELARAVARDRSRQPRLSASMPPTPATLPPPATGGGGVAGDSSAATVKPENSSLTYNPWRPNDSGQQLGGSPFSSPMNHDPLTSSSSGLPSWQTAHTAPTSEITAPVSEVPPSTNSEITAAISGSTTTSSDRPSGKEKMSHD